MFLSILVMRNHACVRYLVKQPHNYSILLQNKGWLGRIWRVSTRNLSEKQNILYQFSLLVPYATYVKLATGPEYSVPSELKRAALQEAQNTPDHPGATTGLFLQAFGFQC